MCTKTRKAPIDPKSKKIVEAQLTTDDLYRELDNSIRLEKEDNERKKNRLAREIVEQGDNLLKEIEEKQQKKEQERASMMQYIYENSKEKFIKIEKLSKLDFDETKEIYERVVEWKKPWWKKLINIFRN